MIDNLTRFRILFVTKNLNLLFVKSCVVESIFEFKITELASRVQILPDRIRTDYEWMLQNNINLTSEDI